MGHEIQRIAVLLAWSLVAACEPNGLYAVSDGEAYLASLIGAASNIREVEESLGENDIAFSVIEAAACGPDGEIWMDPEFVCAGGPAMWLTLSDNARPINPFYSPIMNAFLAFDPQGVIVSTTVLVMGGD